MYAKPTMYVQYTTAHVTKICDLDKAVDQRALLAF